MVDESQDVPYDVLMTKVDVRIGEWGLYNFYKMQVCPYINISFVLKGFSNNGIPFNLK